MVKIEYIQDDDSADDNGSSSSQSSSSSSTDCRQSTRRDRQECDNGRCFETSTRTSSVSSSMEGVVESSSSSSSSSMASIARYCAASAIQSMIRGAMVRTGSRTRTRTCTRLRRTRPSMDHSKGVRNDCDLEDDDEDEDDVESKLSLWVFIRVTVRYKHASRIIQRAWRHHSSSCCSSRKDQNDCEGRGGGGGGGGSTTVSEDKCVAGPEHENNFHLGSKKRFQNRSTLHKEEDSRILHSVDLLPHPPLSTKSTPSKNSTTTITGMKHRNRNHRNMPHSSAVPADRDGDREQAVRKAYEMCQPVMNGVCLGAHEVLNILKAVDVLEPGVHHSLTRKFLRQGEGQSSTATATTTTTNAGGFDRMTNNSKCDARFFLRLSNTADFEKDLVEAGKEICRASSGSSSRSSSNVMMMSGSGSGSRGKQVVNSSSRLFGNAASMPRVKFKFHSFSDSNAANGAREGIIKLVDVPHDCLKYLTKHQGVLTYSDPMVDDLISLLGVHVQDPNENAGTQYSNSYRGKGKGKGGIMEHLRFLSSVVESPWDRARIETISEIVHIIADWERNVNVKVSDAEASTSNSNISTGGPGNKGEIKLELDRANARISSLVDEVEMLRSQMNKLVERERIGHRDGKDETSPSTMIQEAGLKAEAKMTSLPLPPQKNDGLRHSMSMKSHLHQAPGQKKTPSIVQKKGHKAIPGTNRREMRKPSSSSSAATATSRTKSNMNMNAYANSLKTRKVAVVDIKFGKHTMGEAPRKKPTSKNIRPRSRGNSTEGRRDMTYSSTSKYKHDHGRQYDAAPHEDMSLAATLKKSREKRKHSHSHSHSRRVGWKDNNEVAKTSVFEAKESDDTEVKATTSISSRGDDPLFRRKNNPSKKSAVRTTMGNESPSERLNTILEKLNFDNFHRV